jgi:hypothetical protein
MPERFVHFLVERGGLVERRASDDLGVVVEVAVAHKILSVADVSPDVILADVVERRPHPVGAERQRRSGVIPAPFRKVVLIRV